MKTLNKYINESQNQYEYMRFLSQIKDINTDYIDKTTKIFNDLVHSNKKRLPNEESFINACKEINKINNANAVRYFFTLFRNYLSQDNKNLLNNLDDINNLFFLTSTRLIV